MSGLIHTECTWYIILKARNIYGSGFLNGGGGGIRTQWILKICVKYWVSDLYEFNNNL